MRKAIVFAENIQGTNLTRKTVVFFERTIDAQSGQEVEHIQTYIIVMDGEGLLHEAYELPTEIQIPESAFPEPHLIPVPAPSNRIILLNILDPGRSESVPK